jgi:hypothetical protein
MKMRGFTGHKHSKESKLKTSLALKGRKIPKSVVTKRLATRVKNRIPVSEKFFTHVRKTSSCWLWTGSINLHPNKGGYGQIVLWQARGFRKRVKSHRLSWEIHFGKIPIGMCVLHKCDNRKCVNPKHLFLGTQLDNMRDRFSKGRRIVKKQS